MRLDLRYEKKDRKGILTLTLTLLFSFIGLFTFNLFGINALPEIKDNAHDAIAQAFDKAYLNYIYMALAIGVIFGVAWFTGVGKKKREGEEVKKKRQELTSRYGVTDNKKYGTSRYQIMNKTSRTRMRMMSKIGGQ